ncbi:hypothetical protein GCM10007939_21870 [Amylibacter marinus]|uniref:Thiol:disulfide interchange protein DsbD N-terminal domain-containing protein n=1 Tax=Amylibacter marinus TaxID=1475483 RepID=A0ABQ5VWT4_9RHOB|nr:protein-disulfide reductase DsbD domain-containing protein [Amylibacter marinus]GLQ35903.1 hypothetical protein GCM10007939_21870 [Amylibacter marinus]
MKTRHLIALSAILSFGFNFGVAAQEEASPILGLKSVKIIKGWRQADGSHVMAAHISLDRNWKTYWRVAGSGGVPPLFDWAQSINVASAEIKWPAPQVFHDYGVQTIGYKDELILPIVLHPKDKSKPISAHATLDFGVCDDVCVPVRTTITADLPRRAVIGKTEISASLNQVARDAKTAGISDAKCSFHPIEDGMQITATIQSDTPLPSDSLLIIEYPTDDWMNQGNTEVQKNQAQTTATLFSDHPQALSRAKLRLTLLSNDEAAEIIGCS